MGKLCYYEKNNFNKKKETVVFLHGLTGTSDVWEKYYDFFKKKYNVIRIDLLGHGRSKRPYRFSKYSLNSLALNALDVLDKEKIENAHFICHSYSFLISLELYRMRKKMFRSFVFISPYAPNKNRFTWKLSILASYPFGALFYFMPVIGKYSLSDYKTNLITKEVDLKRAFWDAVNTGFKSWVGLNYYAIRFDDLEYAKEIDVPVFIMSGENDGVILWDDVKRIAKRIKNVKLMKLKGKDHIILYPYFDELVVYIEEFLKKVK